VEVGGWRDVLGGERGSQGIVAMFRVEATKSLARQYISN
jgi:hypothetical protein